MEREAEVKSSRAAEEGDLVPALEALAAGRPVLLYDRSRPEHGAYLCLSGVRATAGAVNILLARARGLTCLALGEEKMQALAIPMLVGDSPASRRLAFGASIEAAEGVTTGISAADRARTIAVASRAGSGQGDIVMPGHVFPVQVPSGGVLIKAGVPEAAVDLVAMAGDEAAAALSAVLNEGGDLASVEEVEGLGEELNLPLVDVSEVVAERLKNELVVRRVAEREIESGFGGAFKAIVYRNDVDRHEHVALIAGDLGGEKAVTVRVHSQCLTGDVLGSTRCDCGEQLRVALDIINREGRGVVIYMHQEGRGIGLANKIRAYALQDRGRDTVEANLDLGFKDDLRDYGLSSQILRDLGVRRISLLTNNPHKVAGLERYGVEVVERVALEAGAHADNIGYLRTKKAKLGHIFDEEKLGAAGEPDE